MTADHFRRAARALAKHRGLDAAAVVMAGALAAARFNGYFTYASPSAEERAELVCIAGDSDGFEHFIEAATSRANQFVSSHRRLIERYAEQLAGVSRVGC